MGKRPFAAWRLATAAKTACRGWVLTLSMAAACLVHAQGEPVFDVVLWRAHGAPGATAATVRQPPQWRDRAAPASAALAAVGPRVGMTLAGIELHSPFDGTREFRLALNALLPAPPARPAAESGAMKPLSLAQPPPPPAFAETLPLPRPSFAETMPRPRPTVRATLAPEVFPPPTSHSGMSHGLTIQYDPPPRDFLVAAANPSPRPWSGWREAASGQVHERSRTVSSKRGDWPRPVSPNLRARSAPESFDSLLFDGYAARIRDFLADNDHAQAQSTAKELVQKLDTPGLRDEALAMLADVLRKSGAEQPNRDAADFLLALSRRRVNAGEALGDAIASLSFLYRQGDYADVLRQSTSLEDILETASVDQRLRVALLEGLSLMQLDDNPGAIATFERIVGEAPDSPEAPRAQFLIGWIHLFAEQTDLARAALDKVVEGYPDSEHAVRAKAILEGF